jgi:hypothetical protein
LIEKSEKTLSPKVADGVVEVDGTIEGGLAWPAGRIKEIQIQIHTYIVVGAATGLMLALLLVLQKRDR